MIYTYIRVVSHVYTYRPTHTFMMAYAYIRINPNEHMYKIQPTIYLAFVPLIFLIPNTISQDTANATTAATGICKLNGISNALASRTLGPVKK